MKLWQIALGAVVLGIAYVMITRPKVTNPVATNTTANTANSWLGALVTAGVGAFGKLGGASPGVQSNDVPTPGIKVTGNTLTGSGGQTLTYGPDQGRDTVADSAS